MDKPTPSSPRLQRTLFILLIVVACFGAYINTLGNGFIFDDQPFIVENLLIRSFANLPRVLFSSLDSFDPESLGGGYYRPVGYLVGMVEYALFGLNAWGWRLFNIGFHTLCSTLVFLNAGLLLGGRRGGRTVFALVAALVFALHPVNTEGVLIEGELLYVLFYLLALYLYLRSALPDEGRGGRARLYYPLSVLAFFVSTLSKETALTLPAVLLVYDLTRKRLDRAALKRHVPYWIAAALYLSIRYYALHGGVRAPMMHDPYYYLTMTFMVSATYLWKLALPVYLSFFYYIPTPASLLDARFLLSALTLAAFVAGAWRVSRAAPRSLLYLSLIVVPLLPTFYLIAMDKRVTILAVMAERYLYLPTAGFALLLATGTQYVHERFASRRASAVLAAFIIIVLGLYGAGTHRRNGFLKDDYTIWTKTIEDHPDNYFAHSMLGDMYDNGGMHARGMEEFKKAAALNPGAIGPHYRMGIIYYYLWKMPDKAEAEFKEALAVYPGAGNAAHDLARIYMDRGWWGRAIETLEAALSYAQGRHTAIRLHNALAVCYAVTGRRGEAVAQLKEALRLDPDNAMTIENVSEISGRPGPRPRAAPQSP